MELSGDSTIRPNQKLALKDNQQLLTAASSGIPFAGELAGAWARGLLEIECGCSAFCLYLLP